MAYLQWQSFLLHQLCLQHSHFIQTQSFSLDLDGPPLLHTASSSRAPSPVLHLAYWHAHLLKSKSKSVPGVWRKISSPKTRGARRKVRNEANQEETGAHGSTQTWGSVTGRRWDERGRGQTITVQGKTTQLTASIVLEKTKSQTSCTVQLNA